MHRHGASGAEAVAADINGIDALEVKSNEWDRRSDRFCDVRSLDGLGYAVDEDGAEHGIFVRCVCKDVLDTTDEGSGGAEIAMDGFLVNDLVATAVFLVGYS